MPSCCLAVSGVQTKLPSSTNVGMCRIWGSTRYRRCGHFILSVQLLALAGHHIPEIANFSAEMPSWLSASQGGCQDMQCHPSLMSSPCFCRSSDARNMARDVQNTFYEIVAEYGNMSQPQAVDYVKKLMTKGRYSMDVWS